MDMSKARVIKESRDIVGRKIVWVEVERRFIFRQIGGKSAWSMTTREAMEMHKPDDSRYPCNDPATSTTHREMAERVAEWRGDASLAELGKAEDPGWG